jgi:hypothetical protein
MKGSVCALYFGRKMQNYLSISMLISVTIIRMETGVNYVRFQGLALDAMKDFVFLDITWCSTFKVK